MPLGYNENCIEWIRDEKRATLSLSQRSIISRIMRYAETKPDECQVTAVNEDGSICAHVPVSWVRVSPPAKLNLSDEERKLRIERLHKSNHHNSRDD